MLPKTETRTQLRTTLIDGLQNAGGWCPDPETMIAWENESFDPPTVINRNDVKASMWFRETLYWGNENQIGYGYLEMTSMVKYDVVVPAGCGTKEAEDMVKRIGDVLHHASGINVVTESGETVQISIIKAEAVKSNSFESARAGGASWMAFPCLVTFRAYGLVPGA